MRPVQHGDMSNARHHRAARMPGKVRQGGVPLGTIKARQAHLDQFVVAQGSVGLADDGGCEPGIAHQNHRLEGMREPLQVPALLFGKVHGVAILSPRQAGALRFRCPWGPTLPRLAAVNESSGSNTPTEFLDEVERVRASGTLGRGTHLQRMFDFLVDCSATGRVPKEVEIAVDCFERGAGVDVAQDATVRVTAHKLRRRLEEFYRGIGEPQRLTIPRGEYRLALREMQSVDDQPRGWRRLLPVTGRERIAAAVTIAALAVAAVALGMVLRAPRASLDMAEQRASPLWAPILADKLPVQLVLGDYYIFGERGDDGQIERLVRDFSINSRRELEQGFIADPSRASHYADLNLGYLPTSSAQALREVLPVLISSGKPLMLTLASELDPATLKSTHVVYLGYLSALGMLEDMVFESARYSIGSSYDELIDSKTGEIHTSEAGEAHASGMRYNDYAYLAQFAGPGGQRHLVIAGTRDTGLMEAAEIAADRTRVQEIRDHESSDRPVELLYEVQGVNGINVEARLLDSP